MRAINGFALGIMLAFGTAPGIEETLANAFAPLTSAVETVAKRYVVTTMRHLARLQPEGKCNEHCC